MSTVGALSGEWQVWVAEQLLAGRSVPALVEDLVQHGLAEDLAKAEVRAIWVSPAMTAGRRALPRYRDLEMLRRLSADLVGAGGGRLPVHHAPTAEQILSVYLAHNVPALFPGWCAHWPAVGGWTPATLVERLGDVTVKACVGRMQDSRPDRRWKAHTRELTLAEYAARVLRSEGNDLYMLANHRNLAGPLSPLLGDLRPDPDLVVVERLAGNVSFWFGPRGTVTPTHHDSTNILFCQIFGTKRFWLCPPDTVELSAYRDGFYAPVPLSDPASFAEHGPLAGIPVYEVELQPGDTLFLPAGWWHEVRSTSVSISLSVVGLRCLNRFEDYRPGFAGRAASSSPHG